jgi:ribonuclease D
VARARLGEISAQLAIPVENLMTPDVVRRALWHPPADADLEQVLAGHGARPWQIELVAPVIREALTHRAAEPDGASSDSPDDSETEPTPVERGA